MNTITNHYYHQQVQSTNKKYDSKTNSENEKKFRDLLELQSTATTNQLEVYNYTVQELEDNKVEGASNGQTDNRVHLMFPPESAPEGVKKAYESLSESERANISPFWILSMTVSHSLFQEIRSGKHANIGGGETLVHARYNNFFDKEGFSYIDFAGKLINSWEQNKAFNSTDVYLKKMQTLEKFKSALIENGVS